MIHEAMILEYSGRHLALIEWAASLKLFAYSCIGLALFFPWGIAEAQATAGDAARAAGAGAQARRRRRRCSRCSRRCRPRCASSACPSSSATAFLLAVLGMLVHFLLER